MTQTCEHSEQCGGTELVCSLRAIPAPQHCSIKNTTSSNKNIHLKTNSLIYRSYRYFLYYYVLVLPKFHYKLYTVCGLYDSR